LFHVLFSGRFPKLGPVVRVDNNGSFADTASRVDSEVLPLIQAWMNSQ